MNGVTDRSLLTRQLDAIVDWLLEPLWTTREAACLFVGVLPPERLFDSRNIGACLPGRQAWEIGEEGSPIWDAERKVWRQIIAADVDHIEQVLRDDKRASDHTPQGHLLLGARLHIVPPWTTDFLSSAKHSNAVSSRVRSALREAVGEVTEPRRAAHRSYASRAYNWAEAVIRGEELLRQRKSPKEVADILYEEGFYNGKKGTEPYSDATIRNWRRRLSGDAKAGQPPVSAAEWTEDFRKWRDRNSLQSVKR